MGPHYDSIYFMIRQLPEPPRYVSRSDAPRGTSAMATWQRFNAAPRPPKLGLLSIVPFGDLIRILKQPLSRPT